MKKTFSDEEIRQFQQKCKQIDDNLAVERGGAMRLWLIGDGLRAVRAGGVFVTEDFDDFFAWVKARRGIEQEQTERYLAAASLQPELLAGHCGRLKEMEFISTVTKDLHPGLIEAMHEGASPTALRRGRDHGLSLLRQKVARDEANRKARDRALQKLRARARRTKKERARQAIGRIGKELRTVRTLLGQKEVDIDAGQLVPLYHELSDLLFRHGQLPAMPRGGNPEFVSEDKHLSENFCHESPAAAALPIEAADPGPRFAPIIEAIRTHLVGRARRDLEHSFLFIIRGDPVDEEAHFLKGLHPLLDRGPTRVSAELFAGWLGALCHPDWEQRAWFALWCYRTLGSDSQTWDLRQLSGRQLPQRVRQQVQESLASCN